MRWMLGVTLLLLAGTAIGQDGSISRARFIADMDAQFRAMDSDHNGQLIAAEIEALQRGQASAEASKRNRTLFALLDADKDGKLTAEEFDRFNNPPANTANAAPVVGRMDSNRDGQVSATEHRAAMLVNFDRLDTDHNGIVTAAELKAGGAAPR
jgi:Ca2+-binding EF-hand superfamily protein